LPESKKYERARIRTIDEKSANKITAAIEKAEI
jgi:hypothetical protein